MRDIVFQIFFAYLNKTKSRIKFLKVGLCGNTHFVYVLLMEELHACVHEFHAGTAPAHS